MGEGVPPQPKRQFSRHDVGGSPAGQCHITPPPAPHRRATYTVITQRLQARPTCPAAVVCAMPSFSARFSSFSISRSSTSSGTPTSRRRRAIWRSRRSSSAAS